MDPPKVHSDGTHLYTTHSHLIPTFIHIVGGDPSHIINRYHDTADDAKKIGLGDGEYFYGFDDNEDVTSKAHDAYMDALKNITGSGNYDAQFCIGYNSYQELDDNYEDYIRPLMELISSYS